MTTQEGSKPSQNAKTGKNPQDGNTLLFRVVWSRGTDAGTQFAVFSSTAPSLTE